jgi:tetratricopeptide (TPR) repeat protein
MLAEEATDREEKARRLQESIALLQDAIDRFRSAEDGGPNDLEVRACYSLLGRTYLVMGEHRKALAAVLEANELLTDHSDKDYLDLLILWGEVMGVLGEHAGAEDLFCEALKVEVAGDAEKTEMRARAYRQRARNRERQGQRHGALSDDREAARIWRNLDEREFADEAEWQVVRLTGAESPGFQQLPRRLEREGFIVRLGVWERRKVDLAKLSGSYRGRRLDSGSWCGLLALRSIPLPCDVMNCVRSRYVKRIR